MDTASRLGSVNGDVADPVQDMCLLECLYVLQNSVMVKDCSCSQKAKFIHLCVPHLQDPH